MKNNKEFIKRVSIPLASVVALAIGFFYGAEQADIEGLEKLIIGAIGALFALASALGVMANPKKDKDDKPKDFHNDDN